MPKGYQPTLAQMRQYKQIEDLYKQYGNLQNQEPKHTNPLKVKDYIQNFNMIPIEDTETIMTNRADNKNKFFN